MSSCRATNEKKDERVRQVLYLPRSVDLRVRAAAEEDGRSVSSWIGRAIAAALKADDDRK